MSHQVKKFTIKSPTWEYKMKTNFIEIWEKDWFHIINLQKMNQAIKMNLYYNRDLLVKEIYQLKILLNLL